MRFPQQYRTAGHETVAVGLYVNEAEEIAEVTARCGGCGESSHDYSPYLEVADAAKKPIAWAKDHAKACTAR